MNSKAGIVSSLKSKVKASLSGYRMSPDFIIIGSMKCGTTSLFNYLTQHPLIESPRQKEIHYFDLQFSKGEKWYFNHFPPLYRKIHARVIRRTPLLTGEATPYYMFYPHAAERIAKMYPHIKLIVLLRNPVDRAFSHYHYEVRHGRESLSFEDAIDAEQGRLDGEFEKIMSDGNYISTHYGHHAYKKRGNYVDQLTHWQKWFSRDQFLLLNSESFFSSPQSTVDQVFAFIGLPQWNLPSFKTLNPGKYAEQMSDVMKTHLTEYYRLKNQELYSYLGERYDWD